jgi:LPXTG-motif cell wall-anchored protein
MNKNKTIYNLIFFTGVIAATAVILSGNVYASDNCEDNYGGGETCLVNKRFKIEKWVRLEGEKKDKSCTEWDNEVTVDLTDDDEKDKYIEFCIRVKNLSDKKADLSFDDMKMIDDLPDELKRIGGDGLTENWDDFEPGESKTFKTRVEIQDDEKDRHGEFEKCAVNKAKVYWKKNFEGADTATVCWKKYGKEIKELPKTGAETALAGTFGTGLLAVGTFIKRYKRVK